jgi:hypothetical protein
MAEAKLKVKIDATLNAEPSLKQLRELKKLQKEVGAGTAEWKKIQGAINDTSDKLKTAKGQSEDWIDTLAGLPGPLGMIGRGLDTFTSSTNKLGLAFKSLGIGLIVSAIGALTAAFSQNEKMTKKLQPLLIGFQKILGGIFAAIEPVIDAVLELAVKALPFVTDAFRVVYSAMSSFLQGIGKIGSAIGKLFKGDFAGAWEDAKSSVTDFGKRYDEANKKFIEGSNELTETEKENLEKQKEAREAAAKKAEEAAKKAEEQRKAALEAKKKDLDAQIELEINKENTSREALEKLLQQRLEVELKSGKFSNAEKEKLRQDNKKKVEEALKADTEAEQKAFQERYKQFQDAQKFEVDSKKSTIDQLKALYGENSNEARKAQDELFALQQKQLEDEKLFLEAKKTLSQDEKNRLAQIVIDQQNLTTAIVVENQKRIRSDAEVALKAAESEKSKNDAVYQEKMKGAQFDLELQQSLLNSKIAADQAYYQQLLSIEGLTAEERKKIEADYTATKRANAETQVDIEKKKTDAELALLDAFANGLSVVSDIVGKQTVAGKALSVAASLIATYSAIAKQLSAFAGVPVPGYAIVQAVATGLVGFKAVADIIKTPVPAPKGGGSSVQTDTPRKLASGGMIEGPGTSRSDSIPALLSNGESVINAQSTELFRPLLSTINSIGGGKRFADGGIAASYTQSQAMSSLTNSIQMNQQPIRTYVVSTDMTSNQMLDRVSKSRSTL